MWQTSHTKAVHLISSFKFCIFIVAFYHSKWNWRLSGQDLCWVWATQEGFSQKLTWISCMSVHPVWTRSTDWNHSSSSSREIRARHGCVLSKPAHPSTMAAVLCWLAVLMGIHTSIRYESAFRGGLALTHKQVPHQQRGKTSLLRQWITDSNYWPQSPQMRR